MCKIIRLATPDRDNLTYEQKKQKLKDRRYQLRYSTREWFKNHISTADRIEHIDNNGIWL